MFTLDVLFLLSFGFMFVSVYINVAENRRRDDRQDRKADLDHQRMIQERREFGYDAVEKSIQNKPRPFWHK